MSVVVDTSALIALLRQEPDADLFHNRLLHADGLMSCGTFVETLRVVQLSVGPSALPRVDDLCLGIYRLRLEPVDAEQVRWARHGMLAYGKGRGAPPALLNFGDLFAYALAKARGLPLLFKGADFAGTDVTPAL